MKVPRFRRAAQRRILSETETEQVLAMVDAAARMVAPEEYEAAFADYARMLRATCIAPGMAGNRSGKSTVGIAETTIFPDVGLGVVGQIATRVLLTAEDMAIKAGLANAVAYLRRLRRDKDEAAISAVTARVVATIDVPGAGPSVISQVVRLQIEVLGVLPAEPQSRDSSQQ